MQTHGIGPLVSALYFPSMPTQRWGARVVPGPLQAWMPGLGTWSPGGAALLCPFPASLSSSSPSPRGSGQEPKELLPVRLQF